MTTKQVAVIFAPGFEEIEAITVVDVLRRANLAVTTVAVPEDTLAVKGAHAITLQMDTSLAAAAGKTWDAVVLPGGLPGAHHLRDTPSVQEFLQAHASASTTSLIAAICAAPIALGKAGLLDGRRATCYPGFEAELTGAKLQQDAVVVDGRVVTSRGPGTAMAFALQLVHLLAGDALSEDLRSKMLVAAPVPSKA